MSKAKGHYAKQEELLKKLLKAFLKRTLSWGQAISEPPARAPPHDLQTHVVEQEGI